MFENLVVDLGLLKREGGRDLRISKVQKLQTSAIRKVNKAQLGVERSGLIVVVACYFLYE